MAQATIAPLDAGEVRDIGDVQVETIGTGSGPEEWHGTVRGTITDETGEPMNGVLVETWLNQTRREDTTDARGRFVLTGLPEGYPIAVHVNVPGYGGNGKVVFANDEECNLQIFPQGWDLLGKTAPELNVAKWFRGESTTMDQLRGKVVLLQIGFSIATYHPQQPYPLAKLFETYQAQGLEVVVIHSPLQGSDGSIVESDLAQFVQDNQIRYRFALDQDSAPLKDQLEEGHPNFGATYTLYQASALPTLYLIDRAGKLRISPTKASLETWIERLLAE